MSDIIKQLPDRLANQIAAGEIIQRPASVVKELLENAVDAGASEITLIVRDAGKELIQVIDNGKGMSPMDARMCFERHATSKISNIQDLFTIRTMGFRGEAMASIAAVAQVSLTTITAEDTVGTSIVIEGGILQSQEPIGTVLGTNISVKNLFFNVPARRKFLKSNNSETRHIVDEFTHVAMAYPQIAFKYFNNDTEQMNLRSGSAKNRVVDILGNRFDKFLVNIDEETDYIQVKGFLGKPEIAARSKGNQFLFINNRYIRSPYLHHAIVTAYEKLIPSDEHPFYVLYFEMNPEKVDVNVHPTKQEVKFEDERTIYTFLRSMVSHVLGKFNIAPPIDFSLNADIQKLESLHTPTSQIDIDKVNAGYLSNSFSKANSAHFIDKTNQRQEWEQMKDHFFDVPSPSVNRTPAPTVLDNDMTQKEFMKFPETQESVGQGKDIIHWNDYLVTSGKTGMMFIQIFRAQERIIYDELLNRYLYGNQMSQQLLYPEIIELSANDKMILETQIEDLGKIGFDISSMGGNSFAIHAVPPELIQMDIKSIVEETIETAKYMDKTTIVNDVEKILRMTAKKAAIKYTASKEANVALLGRLFSSAQPEYSPSGEKIIMTLNMNDVHALF